MESKDFQRMKANKQEGKLVSKLKGELDIALSWRVY